jgi:hypothetical protein
MMVELNVDAETAQWLWDASTSDERAIITIFHGGKALNFITGMRSVEIINQPPMLRRNGKPCTVKLDLVQTEPAAVADAFDMNAPAEASHLRDAIEANR